MSVRPAAPSVPAQRTDGGRARPGARTAVLRRDRTRRALLGSLAALAVGLTLAGCSSSGSSANAGATSSAGSAAPLTAADFAARLSAAQDALSSEHMVVTVGSGDSTTTTTADVARRGDTFDMETKIATDGSVQMEVRLLDGIYYFGLGDLTGGKFVVYDPEHPDSLGDLSSTFDALSDQVDPSAAIDAFKDAVVSVTADGAPDAHGVQAYVVVADTSKIGGVIGDQLTQAAKSGAATAPATLTYRFGVDAQDRIRTMATTIGSTTSTIEFSDFGEHVTVHKPSADEIVSADELGS